MHDSIQTGSIGGQSELECHSGRVGSGSGPSGPDPVLGRDQNKIPGTDPNSRRVGVGNSRSSRMHRPPA